VFSQIRPLGENKMNHKDNAATLTNGDTTVKIELPITGLSLSNTDVKISSSGRVLIAPDVDEYDANFISQKSELRGRQRVCRSLSSIS
jgi:hypothetical protein